MVTGRKGGESVSKLNLFIPITKIDEENRLVYGRIAAEEIDNSGEMFDYESSKPNFEKWSNDQYEASGGLSKGNVRAMHGAVAAGKLTDIHFDDSDRTIEGVAKIVDDNEWQKCLAGVYTGFSMGGRYERRWNDAGVRKYTALPAEVSIVDKPCIKSARFADLVKMDGSVEQLELGKAWDESKHPRNPKGSSDGGKFTGAKSGNTWNDRVADASEEAEQQHQDGMDAYHEGKKRKDNPHPADTDSDTYDVWDMGYTDARDLDRDTDYGQSRIPEDDAEIEDSERFKAKGDPWNKGDNMDYEPTNDEMLARATDLAKAAGSGGWLDYKDQAITELRAEHAEKLGKADAPVHNDADCKVGETCEKCMEKAVATDDLVKTDGADGVVEGEAPGGDADLNKADDLPELSQGWQAKDGSFHLKKADAIAHNERVASGPSLADQIAELRKSVATDADPVAVLTDAVVGLSDEDFAKFVGTERLQKFVDDRLNEAVTLAKTDGIVSDEDREKLEKFASVSEENDLLKTQITGFREEIAAVGPALADLRSEIALIKSMPIPGGPAATDVRTVDKGEDQLLGKGGGEPKVSATQLLDQLEKSISSGELSREQVADMAIRAAQSVGTKVSL